MTSWHLQMIEEDLFFPGKRVDHDDDDKSFYGRDDASSMITLQASFSSESHRTSFSINGHDETDRETLRLGNVPEHVEPVGSNESSSRQDAPATPSTRSALLGTTSDDGTVQATSRPASPVFSSSTGSGGSSIKGHRFGGSWDADDPTKPTGGGRHHTHTHAQIIHPATTATTPPAFRLAAVVRAHLRRAVRALYEAARAGLEDADACVGGARGAHVRLVRVAARVDGVPRVPGPARGGTKAAAQDRGGGEEEPRAAAGLAAHAPVTVLVDAHE